MRDSRACVPLRDTQKPRTGRALCRSKSYSVPPSPESVKHTMSSAPDQATPGKSHITYQQKVSWSLTPEAERSQAFGSGQGAPSRSPHTSSASHGSHRNQRAWLLLMTCSSPMCSAASPPRASITVQQTPSPALTT